MLCKMLQCKTKYKCLKDDLMYSGTFPAAFEASTSGDINDNLDVVLKDISVQFSGSAFICTHQRCVFKDSLSNTF